MYVTVFRKGDPSTNQPPLRRWAVVGFMRLRLVLLNAWANSTWGRSTGWDGEGGGGFAR